MPCFHPLVMLPAKKVKYFDWIKGKNVETGSKILLSLDKLPWKWYNDSGRGICLIDPDTGETTPCVTVPCGKCSGCRIDYSQDWTSRILCELQTSSDCWFLTMTLSEEALADPDRLSKLASYSDYELKPNSLYPPEASLFLHRLQDELRVPDRKLSFYCSGEYGEQYGRCHYHACVFNCALNDLYFWEYSKLGYPLYRSLFLERIWKKGIVVVGELNQRTAGYTARYVMKKRKGTAAEAYKVEGLVPEFCRMSRRPGIGEKYFEDNWQDIYITDKLYLPERQPMTPPRYFDKLLEKRDPALLQKVKNERSQKADIYQKSDFESREYSEAEYFTIQERQFDKKISALRRSLL